MARVIKMVATIVLILCGFAAVIAHRGTAGAVVAGLALTVLVILLAVKYREKRSVSALPKELARLAYRNDQTTVAFVWTFRRGHTRRVRILRSETGFAPSADSCDGQVRIYEGDGDQVVDSGLVARRSYFYSVFVERRRGGWATAVRQEVMMISSEERAAIEKSYRGSAPADPEDDGSAWAAAGPFTQYVMCDTKDMSATVIGSGFSALATDAVFAVAGIFAGGEELEEWVEIA